MFHLLPFLAGAAAGAAITYIVKDRETQNRIREAADKVGDSLRDGVDRTARAARALARPGGARADQDKDASTASDA